MLTQLERANIGHDCPAIAGGNLRGIRRHRAIAFADDAKEMPDRSIAQAIDVVGRRLRVSPLDDLSAAGAQRIVANHAIDQVAVAAMLNYFACDREAETPSTTPSKLAASTANTWPTLGG